MGAKIWGRPPVPDPVELKEDDLVTRFDCYVVSASTTVKGVFQMTIAVPTNEKYKASLMVDLLNELLHMEVYTRERSSDEVLETVKQLESLESKIESGEVVDLSDV